ncbi:MAG: NTP transferase domain-containing protein [Burkholderiaceae bacterium]|nr:NTP transferase domain-containing protein [Burkholderiaceae bacterium]
MAATILAAGLGLRLGGRPKATLQVGGISVLERLVAALRAAGVPTVSVVIGPYRDQLLPLIERCGAHAVLHRLDQPSLVQSQRRALDEHRARFAPHDLLLLLGDLPRLSAADMAPLLTAWQGRAPSVHALMPMVGGVRGHPLLLSRHAVQQISALPDHVGVRDWLAAHPSLTTPFPTPQPAHITDLDTPDDVAALQAHFHPTPVAWPPASAPGETPVGLSHFGGMPCWQAGR